jgi:electron transfer flavoprotein alpha subunit
LTRSGQAASRRHDHAPLAEHDNKTLKDATHKALTAAKALVPTCMCWSPARGAGRSPRPPPSSTASSKVLLADGAAYEHMLAEPVAALVLSLAPGL